MELKQEYEIDKDSYYKAKKYVIKIYPENLRHVEDLESRDRDQFINEAISVYLGKYSIYQKQVNLVEKLKKILTYTACTLMIFALLAGIFRFMLIYSDAVNNEMGGNFEKLFNKYNSR